MRKYFPAVIAMSEALSNPVFSGFHELSSFLTQPNLMGYTVFLLTPLLRLANNIFIVC
jgi:hypothetical protein